MWGNALKQGSVYEQDQYPVVVLTMNWASDEGVNLRVV